MSDMRRREFMALLGGAAAWPLAARAQQPTMPVIGFLNPASPDGFVDRLRGFRQGLKDTGYVEGENVTIEYRWAENHIERLPLLAADLVRRQVNVIAAFAGDIPAVVAKAATTTIPIVFLNGADPVKSGLVASLNRPGGNVTGISLLAGTVNAKRLDLIHELVPRVALVAVLNNPIVTEAETRLRDLQGAARTLGVRLLFQTVGSERELDAAFATIADQKAGALFVDGNPFFVSRRDQLIRLAARQTLPTMYFEREFAAAGGLMSYGTNFADAYRQAGIYIGRILKGTKPADLPILQPTKFDFVINLQTAKTLGIEVPDKLLALADEVIE
jgi:putative tryptophan/tyrosine transport system substrate-binding protein